MTHYIGLYKKTSAYYEGHPEQVNMVTKIESYMSSIDNYEHPQIVLSEIFLTKDEEKSYVANEYFVKNKEKYLPKEVLEYNQYNEIRLTYMDSFLTRYVYFSFTRWMTRMNQFLSLSTYDN